VVIESKHQDDINIARQFEDILNTPSEEIESHAEKTISKKAKRLTISQIASQI